MLHIPENADVLGTLTRRGIAVPPHLMERLAAISAKTHNNYVGYYQFRDGEEYHRLLIVPKIFDDPTTYEHDFVRLFKRYFQLNARYGSALEPLLLDGNVLDLVFAPDELERVQTIPEFLELTYRRALATVQAFLRRHAQTRRRPHAYAASTVRDRIDVGGNVRQPDKSRVVQTSYRTDYQSDLAEVLRGVLRHFLRHRLPHLEHAPDLRRAALVALRDLNRRYRTGSGFRFRPRDLPTHRIRQLFRANETTRLVYRAALQLAGAEQFAGAGLGDTPIKLDGMTALFFRPEQLYEWMVYDALVQRGWTVERQELRSYELLRGDATLLVRESRPDFIARRGAETILVDAKWKWLHRPADLLFADIAKLERDWQLRREEVTDCWLVYPRVDFEWTATAALRRDFDAAFSFRAMEVRGF